MKFGFRIAQRHRHEILFIVWAYLALIKPPRCTVILFDTLQVIDVKRSYVTMTATKIEITMRKAEPMQWASLELPAAKNQEKQKEDTAE